MNFPTYADAQVYYQWGFDISFCVEGGAITPDQFKEITGKDYGEETTETAGDATPSAGSSESTGSTAQSEQVKNNETAPVTE
ncbi:XkdX family protein [Bacillus velezensis]|uniref:XkdX family protein n=1 Tax=Bacillus TaxID=1386 RepID=UPI00044ECA04|nr:MULTISPECIES: XkdX family protein [Bacillus amyloliquefaciens group]EYB35380.1 hypothetical protein AW26_0114820 [Bacillus amyloliquefaciens EBL11]MEC0927905.1 XkdX family protein [Bacillus velezensis]MEC0972319.1 XkdX family protein [Bacillus velezensis]NYZ56485.1 hypothetical protein [Bacillus amyloliquefaciens]QWC47577.1 XkdX family protein [Bacillus velezensis]